MSAITIYNAGAIPVQATDPLLEISNRFLYTVKRDFTPGTYKSFVGGLEIFKRWYITLPKTDSFKDVLLEYKAFLKSTYSNTNTINTYITAIRGLSTFLYEHGFTDTDESRHLKNIKRADDFSRKALNKYERHALLDTIGSMKYRNAKRDRMIAILALYNGLRVKELSQIELSDFSTIGEDRVVYLLRKGYSDKTCYCILNPKVDAELREYIGDRTTGALFPSEQGTNLSSESVSRIIRNIFIKAGIKNKYLTAHSLRSTFAVMCIEQDINIIDVSKAMNHKSVETTQIYLRSLDRHKRSAEKALDINF